MEKIKIYLQQNINQEQMQQAMKKQHEDNIAAYKEEYRDCQKKQDQMKNKSIQNYEAYRAGEITREQDVYKRQLKRNMKKENFHIWLIYMLILRLMIQ